LEWAVSVRGSNTPVNGPYNMGDCLQCIEGNVRFVVEIGAQVHAGVKKPIEMSTSSRGNVGLYVAEVFLKICSNGYAKAQVLNVTTSGDIRYQGLVSHHKYVWEDSWDVTAPQVPDPEG